MGTLIEDHPLLELLQIPQKLRDITYGGEKVDFAISSKIII